MIELTPAVAGITSIAVAFGITIGRYMGRKER